MAASTKLNRKQRCAFLDALALQGNVTQAAAIAGLGRWKVYEQRKEDPEFAQQWEQALRESEDRLEAEAVRRAVEGVEEPYFYQGEQRGASRKYSDQLLMFLLKSKRPERFGTGASGLDEDGANPAATGVGPVVFELHLAGEKTDPAEAKEGGD
ncbi:MAG: hypothetical protein AB7E32_10780 [Desulfovibrio sp.]